MAPADTYDRDAPELAALLQPSFARPREPIFSARAGFLVAFFGGVHATLIFSFLNSRRLGRERTDAWWYALLALAGTAAIAVLAYLVESHQLPSWLVWSSDARRDVRTYSRACALVVFAVSYFRLRPYYTAAALSGHAPPNPWKAGIAASVAGAVITFCTAALATMVASPR
ncbi:MAG TPA: hypothetical protein VFN67_31960 [Polyangiales bacterium]|nr:hypothetical protein [Polyangiales bacterium]